MRTRLLLCVWVEVALSAPLLPLAGAQTPAGTAFKYQGRLTDGGSVVRGGGTSSVAITKTAAGPLDLTITVPPGGGEVIDGIQRSWLRDNGPLYSADSFTDGTIFADTVSATLWRGRDSARRAHVTPDAGIFRRVHR